MSSKRQIQFLCAFLLEFDRREQQNEADGGAVSQYPMAKSEHVAAHLSVMKTHQRQFPSGGLIMDFCSQTRSRYLELLKKEQSTAQVAATSGSVDTGKLQKSGRSKQPSVHSVKIQSMVRENIQIYRDTKKLPSQLRQWRMFQPQLWKKEFVPCCLDVEYDSLGDHEASSAGDAQGTAEHKVLEHASFVHALATTGVISPQEYSQFVSKVEAWVEERQTAIQKKRIYKRQRQDLGKGLSHAVERLQLEMAPGKETELWEPRRVPQERMEMLGYALESTLDSLRQSVVTASQPNSASNAQAASQMQSVWEDGCVRVLACLGLSELDAFFAYLVPVLARSTAAHGEDAQPSGSQSEKEVLEVFTQYCVSQLSWTKSTDEGFMQEMGCICAVLVAFLAKSGTPHSHKSADPVLLLRQVDEKYFGGDSKTAPSEPSYELLVRRSIFYTVILRALGAVPAEDQPPAAMALLQSESLNPGTREWIAWLAFRSTVVAGGHQVEQKTSYPGEQSSVQHGDRRLNPLQFLANNLRAVSQTKWCKQVLDASRATKDQQKKLLTLEFRYGLKLFGDPPGFAAPSQPLSNAGSMEWLQLQLGMMEDIGRGRGASTEDMVEWIIQEIVEQSSRRSEAVSELLGADNSIAQMLLLLNDLMHKLHSQQTAGDLALKSSSSLGSHERILEVFVRSVLKASERGDHPLSESPRLQHHGYEILEICARHQSGSISSKSANRLLELINQIGDRFHDQMPWSLLRAVFVYLTQIVSSASDNVQSALETIRDFPLTIIVRCGLECRRIQAVSEHSHRENGTRKALQSFMALLQWVHQFCNQVLREVSTVRAAFESEPSNAVMASDVAGIFPTEVDKMKYRIHIVKLLFRWNMIHVPVSTTQSHAVSSFHRETARRVMLVFDLDASADVSRSSGHSDGQRVGDRTLVDLGTYFADEWQRAVSTSESTESHKLDFHFQLFSIHMVAEGCQRSAQLSEKLLRSWREPSSLSNGSATFLALLAIVLSDAQQLEKVCSLNSSVWMSEFPQVALHLHSLKSGFEDPSAAGSFAEVRRLINVIANTKSFKAPFVDSLRQVLQHGIDTHVDVLDSTLPSRIRQAWPSLSSVVSQLRVIAFDEPNEF